MKAQSLINSVSEERFDIRKVKVHKLDSFIGQHKNILLFVTVLFIFGLTYVYAMSYGNQYGFSTTGNYTGDVGNFNSLLINNTNITYFNGSDFVSAEISPAPYTNLNGQNRFTIQNYVNFTNIARINEVYYVETNNGSDIQTKLDLCNSTGCKVILPCGNYNINQSINITGNVNFEGQGECSIINMTANRRTFIGLLTTQEILMQNFQIKANNLSHQSFDFSSVNTPVSLTFKNIHVSNQTARVFQFNTSVTVMMDNIFLDNVAAGIGIYPYSVPTTSAGVTLTLQNSKLINNNYNSANPSEYGEGIDCNYYGTEKSTCNIINNVISGFREEDIDCDVQICNIIGNKLIGVASEIRPSNVMSFFPENLTTQMNYIAYNDISEISLVNGSGIKIIGVNTGSNTIIGNTIKGNSSSKSLQGIAVTLAGNTFIVGNEISNFTRGIAIYYNTSSTVLLNNRFNSNTKNVVNLSWEEINNDLMPWNFLNNFPVACPAGSYLTQLGTSTVCTTPTSIYDISKQSLIFGVNFNSNSIDETIVIDSSEYNYNPTVKGGAYWNSTTGFNSGGAYTFPNSTSRIERNNVTLNMNTYTTLSAWAKIYSSNLSFSDAWIIVLRNQSGAYTSPYFNLAIRDLSGIGRLQARLTLNSSCDITARSLNTTLPYNDEIYHHVVGIQNLTTISLYIDGIFQSSTSISTACQQNIISNGAINYSLTIGNGYTTINDGWLNSTIDDVRVYNRALSTSEILNLYSSRAEVQNAVVSKKGNYLPSLNNIYSLGSSLFRWASGWFVDLDVSGTALLNVTNITNGRLLLPLTKSATPSTGSVYYNTTNQYPCFYNGTAWYQANKTVC